MTNLTLDQAFMEAYETEPILRKMVKHPFNNNIDDIIQSLYLYVPNILSKFNGTGTFRGYFINQCSYYIRKEQATILKRERNELSISHVAKYSDIPENELIGSYNEDYGQIVDTEEEIKAIEDKIKDLPQFSRVVYTMRFKLNMSVREIAETVKTSDTYIYNVVNDIISKLKMEFSWKA